MRTPVSSFPAEIPAVAESRLAGVQIGTRRSPWYRETWPWLLASGPALVVVASVFSAWLALSSDDGVVAEDYYKRGLLINQELKRTATGVERNLGALIKADATGNVQVQMEGVGAGPESLRLKLAHPTRSANDQVVVLTRTTGGEYVGRLASQTPGRWIVILESDAWRLPTTTLTGPLREIRLGTASARSAE